MGSSNVTNGSADNNAVSNYTSGNGTTGPETILFGALPQLGVSSNVTNGSADNNAVSNYTSGNGTTGPETNGDADNSALGLVATNGDADDNSNNSASNASARVMATL